MDIRMKKMDEMINLRRREGFRGQRLFVLPRSWLLQAQKHPLLRGLFVTDVGYFPEAPGHWVERTKGIPEMILIGCLSGRGWLRLDGESSQVIESGQVAFILPGLAHAYGADEQTPWSIVWAHFRGEDLEHYVELLKVTSHHPLLRLPTQTLEKLGFDEVHGYLESGCTLHNLLAACCHFRWSLCRLARYQLPQGERARSTSESIQQNIDWMRMHCHQRFGLADLARQAGLSVPHYSALFRKKTGNSPLNYFQRLKIQHACELLVLTDLPISEVAGIIGLEDPFYFSRIFKKVMGSSPRSFRRERQT
jgi:AraC-like DNA-binding protein